MKTPFETFDVGALSLHYPCLGLFVCCNDKALAHTVNNFVAYANRRMHTSKQSPCSCPHTKNKQPSKQASKQATNQPTNHPSLPTPRGPTCPRIRTTWSVSTGKACRAGWLVGWLVGGLVGWLVGWLVAARRQETMNQQSNQRSNKSTTTSTPTPTTK